MVGKNKKQAASVMALSAILAAQSLMPVSAAGGTIGADMSTKSPIIRVNVPTKMAVAVNEFEMGDEGSQVTSDAFTMKNLSEVPVNVKVSSTATVGASTTLVSTKAAAKGSTDETNAAMWLAAVAATAAGEYATGSDTTVKALAGTEYNVTAFGTKNDENKSTAVQNFYLQAASAAAYEGITGDEVTAAQTEVGNGADYYELTEATLTGDNAAGVAALAKNQDVYIAKAGAIADGTAQALTKIAKGTEAADITGWTANTSKAYTMATTATASGDLSTSKFYLYIKTATAPASGDSAEFRYIGALSEAKSGWSTSDLSSVSIEYDIVAISGTAYTNVAGDDGSKLVYGYEKEHFTDATADGSWGDAGLWLSKDGENAFSTTGLKVEVSADGNTYKTLAADKYTVNDGGWVNVTWDSIVEGLGSTPSGNVFVRVIDGNTRYVYEQK